MKNDPCQSRLLHRWKAFTFNYYLCPWPSWGSHLSSIRASVLLTNQFHWILFNRKISRDWKEDWILQSVFLPCILFTFQFHVIRSWRSKAYHRSRLIPLPSIHVLQSNWLLRWFRQHSMVDILGRILFRFNYRKHCRFFSWINPLLFFPEGSIFHLVVPSKIYGSGCCLCSSHQASCNSVLEFAQDSSRREEGGVNLYFFMWFWGLLISYRIITTIGLFQMTGIW